MIIVKVWTHPRSGLVGLLVAATALLWPAIPLRSLSVWLQTLVEKFPTNLLYPFFALLVGSYAALYAYDRWVARCCRTRATKTATPSILGIFLGACPACIPFIAFFLPISVTIVFGRYSWMFLTASMLLLLFSIWRAGGFQKQAVM